METCVSNNGGYESHWLVFSTTYDGIFAAFVLDNLKHDKVGEKFLKPKHQILLKATVFMILHQRMTSKRNVFVTQFELL